MTHPSKPDRRAADTRVLTDLPDGIDDPAAIGSTRKALRYATGRSSAWRRSPKRMRDTAERRTIMACRHAFPASSDLA
jgi:hypothetical protein